MIIDSVSKNEDILMTAHVLKWEGGISDRV
jgi:hypothetical protein